MTPQLDALMEQKMHDYFGAGNTVPVSRFLTLEDLESIPDEELLEVLADEGLPCTREDFDELTRTCTSSDEVYDALVERNGALLIGADEDLTFMAVMELCLRWNPQWVSADALTEAMLDGYELVRDPLDRPDACAIADAWGKAWELVPQLARKWHVLSLDAFDQRFNGIYNMYDWINDYDFYLHEAELRDPAYTQVRQAFARDFDRVFPRELYDVLRMHREPDGTYTSEFDELEKDYETSHTIPFVGDQAPAPTNAPAAKVKIGRNDPCPCGSGKKYKKCCGRKK